MSVRERTATHPLDALTAEEIRAAVSILRQARDLTDDHRFAMVALHEPAKERVLAHRPGDPVEREVLLVVYERGTNSTYETVVSLGEGVVRSWEHVPGVQPMVMLEEFDEAERLVRESAAFQEAVQRRGISDVDALCVDPWSWGSYGQDDRDRRLIRALVWMRQGGPDDNFYAHPVDGLVAIIDLGNGTVEVEDYGVVPVPRAPGNYTPDAVGPLRDDLAPLDIVQPDGPSFEVSGNEVRWHRWSLRIGFTQREGLVLHTVGFEDGDEVRPIVYRASLSSMIVPYGDISPTQYRKNAFDVGEYQIGGLTNSLELGCDCLGEIEYFDAVLADAGGVPYTIKNAICMHEEDVGLLWKHFDMRTGKAEVRRSRRLVISFIATFANYEYAFYWYLYQDGTLEHEVKLTGIMTTGALGPGKTTPYGTVLNEEGLYAPNHQHFFNYRLDVDLDGRENAVYEVNTESPPRGERNPYGNAFVATDTLLASESAAQRLSNPASDRHWKIVNRARTNKLGQPVAYRLMPKTGTRPYWHDDAHVEPRGRFADRHLWVTPHAPGELYGAGDYPNQNPDPGGLPVWTEQDRDLVDRDLVVWFTMGTNHVPRLEDWPVMPVQHIAFKLEPFGFFDANPALDAPTPSPGRHCSHH
jgi:primary-amine oxidase